MLSMNKKVKEKVMCQVASDKYDTPIFLFKNLKNEIFECALKYLNIKKDNMIMNVKVLKNGKFFIEIKFLSDNLILFDSDK